MKSSEEGPFNPYGAHFVSNDWNEGEQNLTDQVVQEVAPKGYYKVPKTPGSNTKLFKAVILVVVAMSGIIAVAVSQSSQPISVQGIAGNGTTDLTTSPTVSPSSHPTPPTVPTPKPTPHSDGGVPTTPTAPTTPTSPTRKPTPAADGNPSTQPPVSPTPQPTPEGDGNPSTQPPTGPTPRPTPEGDGSPPTSSPSSPTVRPTPDPDGPPATAPPHLSPSPNPDGRPPSPGNPTQTPTDAPTKVPTLPEDEPRPPTIPGSPTFSPVTTSPSTSHPSKAPSTSAPTKVPSESPPSTSPTTSEPSVSPSFKPSTSPTVKVPSTSPTNSPESSSPTQAPTNYPTTYPSHSPTITSVSPTTQPTLEYPTKYPSRSPSTSPSTSKPSVSPTTAPSKSPTITPTDAPSVTPTTSAPSTSPTTSSPSISPTQAPTPAPQCLFQQARTDVLWIIDESKSIGDASYDQLLDEIVELSNSLEFGTYRFGLVEFSGASLNADGATPSYMQYYYQTYLVRNHYPTSTLKDLAIQSVISFNDYATKNEFQAAVSGLKYQELIPDSSYSLDGFTWNTSDRGLTCMSCAFQYILDEYYPVNYDPTVEHVVIFVGDGRPNRGYPRSPEQPLRDLRAAFPFRMFFIPVGSDIDIDVFENSFMTTEYPNDNLAEVNSYSQLQALFEILIDCNTSTT